MLAAVNVVPAHKPPLPPFWCPAHGWVVCSLHEYGHGTAPHPEDEGEGAGLQPPTVGLSPTSSTSALDADAIERRLPSPTLVVIEVGTGTPLLMPPSVARPMHTPRVQVREDDAVAFVSAPIGASSFAFGSGMRSFSSAAFADAVAPPRLPSPKLATPRARRRPLLLLHLARVPAVAS
jgi:hypothetical protein